MSQRNPQNQRYVNRADNYGKSRKSAASAKPKSNAASSVRAAPKKSGKSAKMTKKQRDRVERDKQYEAEQRYGDPPSKKFKIYKRIWIGGLVAAVIFIAAAFGVSKAFPEAPQWVMYALFGCSWASILVTLYVDLGKIRKMRREYAARMRSMRGKEIRAEEKRMRAEARAAQKKQAEAEKNGEAKKPDTFVDKIKQFFMRS